MNSHLLEVISLTISLATSQELKTIVDSISFSINSGEVLAIVGQSGSGKTVTARAILQLFSSQNLMITSGSILLKGSDLVQKNQKEMRLIRGKEIGYIPQNPMSALNPMMLVGSQIMEGYYGTKKEAQLRASDLLIKCGFTDPKKILYSYPHELSGGMKQRAVIAMALMNGPDLIIADEPTTALDVSIQAEIIDLLLEIVETSQTALLFITHDLGVVARIADQILIMKSGKIIENQDVYNLFENPREPYTKHLIDSSTFSMKALS